MKPHHKLDVWKRAIKFVEQIYKITSSFPPEEKFGLTSQMRRASISIPSNIAEGSARNSSKEFINFLHISQGSVAELETQIIISKNLQFLDSQTEDVLLKELDEISKMIIGLQKSVRK
ncbi:MAG: four helix bundle protein [Nitrospinae bacterium]|nr:four helix bundle protein [Nitrospinota bacterium]